MIDSIDEKIINSLLQDANCNRTELAKQLGLSPITIRRRIQKLTQHVLRIIAIPDPVEIGCPVIVVIGFDVVFDKLSLVMNTLSDRPEVKWLAATSGRFDIIASAWFHSTEELFNFMKMEISKLEGVRNSETFICLHIGKRF